MGYGDGDFDLHRYYGMNVIWGKEDYEGRKNTSEPYFQILTKIQEEIGQYIDFDSILFFDDDADCIDAARKTGLRAVHIGNGPNQKLPEKSFHNLASTKEIPDFLEWVLHE